MDNNLPDNIIAVCQQFGFIDKKNWHAHMLAGDGSSRSFYRLRTNNTSVIVTVPPMNSDSRIPDKAMAEAHSAYLIGRHLHSKGIPVPEILAFDDETGIIFFEDLGEELLHDRIIIADKYTLRSMYKQAVTILVNMQFKGFQGFKPEWCWDSPVYDRKLMLHKESDYFIKAFCKNYLGLKTLHSGLIDEFELIAARAEKEPRIFFLHRDFQSRNLMVLKGEIRVIDFQGGRLGPLAYDLASLLIDPYTDLSNEFQEELFHHYLAIAEGFGINKPNFISGYYYLALQRNLQILGAFAFLSQAKGKPFFRQYIKPAVITLNQHLAKKEGEDYPCLRKIAGECLHLLTN